MSEIQPQVLKTLRPTLQGINQGKRRTHTFNVDFTEYDPKFKGTFVVHHPSQIERMQAGVIKSQLLNGIPTVDVMTDNIATIISILDVVLDEKPDWFDVFDSDLDYDIMEAVYIEYTEWLNSFRLKRAGQPKRDSQDRASEVRVVDTENVENSTN